MTYPVERLRNHLDAASLLTGYTVKYDRWSDSDLASKDSFVVFRLAGTGGDSAFDIQQPDIRVIIVAVPEVAQTARNTAWKIIEYLRKSYSDSNAWLYEPIGFPQGPSEMSDGRVVWEVTVRVHMDSKDFFSAVLTDNIVGE